MKPRVTVSPATTPRPRGESRLLVWKGARSDAVGFADLARSLAATDLVVVNDSATFPASLRGKDADGHELELRLTSAPDAHGEVIAVLFGAGDYRTRTEDRPAPPVLAANAELRFGKLHANVVARLDHPRLLRVRFGQRGSTLLHALYMEGRPVQYAYVPKPLALWDVQNVYAGPAVSAELPSAGYAMSFGVLESLRAKGVRVVALTHAAGLSSTGDAELDRRLPLPERYSIPEATLSAIRETRAAGGRVVAVGTSVVRALEASALSGAASGITDLRIDASHRLRVVSAILTGVHAPGESHYDLLEAFLPRRELDAAFTRASDLGLLGHEFGDAILFDAV